jgi:hypothetical protein
MAAVAERLVLRRATAAQSDPRVFPYQPTVRVDDADGASDEERTIRTWLDRGFLRRLFLPTAIETAVVERAGRTALDRGRDRDRVSRVYDDPRSCLWIEDLG